MKDRTEPSIQDALGLSSLPWAQHSMQSLVFDSECAWAQSSALGIAAHLLWWG